MSWSVFSPRRAYVGCNLIGNNICSAHNHSSVRPDTQHAWTGCFVCLFQNIRDCVSCLASFASSTMYTMYVRLRSFALIGVCIFLHTFFNGLLIGGMPMTSKFSRILFWVWCTAGHTESLTQSSIRNLVWLSDLLSLSTNKQTKNRMNIGMHSFTLA